MPAYHEEETDPATRLRATTVYSASSENSPGTTELRDQWQMLEKATSWSGLDGHHIHCLQQRRCAII
jgi:hypothetical protein